MDDLAKSYHKTLSATQGRPCKDARIVIGAIIIKHKLSLSDEEMVEQIRENPYLQYFIGLKGFQSKAPFVPSLLVEVRKRMGQGVFDEFHEAIIASVERKKPKPVVKNSNDGDADGTSPYSDTGSDKEGPSLQSDNAKANELPQNHGKLILDATVAEQAIRYPTDLSLLDEARELRISIEGELFVLLQRISERKLWHKIRSLSLIVNIHGQRLTACALRGHFDRARAAAGIGKELF